MARSDVDPPIRVLLLEDDAVVRRVRAVAPAAAIIAHTGLDDDRRRAEALSAGAPDCVVKGTLEGTVLAAVIDAAIERRRRETHARV